MPSRLKAPPSPGFLTGNTLPQTTGADARYETSPAAPGKAPEPPAEGWTLAQAAEALCPEEWRKAQGAGRRLDGRVAYTPSESGLETLRKAFIQRMERGDYVADGLSFDGVETIPADRWREARPSFALPGEQRRLRADIVSGPRSWDGVRIRRPAAAPMPKQKPDAKPTTARRLEYSDKGLRGWFRLRVDRWPKDAPPPSEKECLAAAREHFEGRIGRDPFRVIRREMVPENWQKSGPRKAR